MSFYWCADLVLFVETEFVSLVAYPQGLTLVNTGLAIPRGPS